MLKNSLTNLLQINYPIIQAPMAGGITTTHLVAEVSINGGLGMIGAGYMEPEEIRNQAREIKLLTSNMFGINLFVPNEFYLNEEEITQAKQILKPIHNHLNLPENNDKHIKGYSDMVNTFHKQIEIVIEEKIPVCSFTFGIPQIDTIQKLKQHHIILVGTATTVQEAIEIEKSGMNAVVVQGSEAGGHRGNFIDQTEHSLIGLMSLIPQVADQVNIPVIAAGGIMDGRGLMASICLGAKGVQMGTAFLTCVESGAHELYKEAILNTHEDDIVLTRSFSGKWARGINNRFISDLKNEEHLLPEFPIQNSLTQQIRKASSTLNNLDYMSLWSGQSPRLAKRKTVKSLMTEVMGEANNLFPKS